MPQSHVGVSASVGQQTYIRLLTLRTLIKNNIWSFHYNFKKKKFLIFHISEIAMKAPLVNYTVTYIVQR